MLSCDVYPSLDDMSLYDFMFSSNNLHVSTDSDFPWFVDAVSGERWTRLEVQERTDALALGWCGVSLVVAYRLMSKTGLQTHTSSKNAGAPTRSTRGEIG